MIAHQNKKQDDFRSGPEKTVSSNINYKFFNHECTKIDFSHDGNKPARGM